jgi:hypothetical protein
VLELSAITERFSAYVSGASSRSGLESWIAEQVLTVSTTDLAAPVTASPAQILAYSIGESFCALQRDDEEASHFAARVLSCLNQVPDLEDVQDMLPLIRHHESFAVLISKHARGLISPIGFKSIVKKRFTFDAIRPWLEEASHERLTRLAEMIEREDFVGLRSLLTLPPA